MMILFLARNIPIPGLKDNDIILQFAGQLQKAGIKVEIWYPAEWLPLPSFLLRGKHRAVARLGKCFESCGLQVKVLRYLRLPFRRHSYLLTHWFYPRPSLQGVDLIHAHHIMPDGQMGCVLSKKGKVPLVVTVRQGDWLKMNSLASSSTLLKKYQRVLQKARLILSPGRVLTDALSRKWQVAARPLPHGVDEATPGVGISQQGEDIQVAVVAALIPRKQVDWVIRAVKNYSGSRKIRLVIAGEGPEKERLAALAEGMGPAVEFVGRVARSRVFKILRESAIFTLPSQDETFGLVYLEAGIRGCAVLASKGTGVYGYFEEGQEMCFCENDFSAYQEGLWKMLDQEDFRKTIATGGYRRSRKDYLWEAVINNYLKQIEEIKSQKTPK